MNALTHIKRCAALAVGLGISLGAQAQDASQLGKSLTPIGAVAAGNEAGTIPAWTGGLTESAPAWEPGSLYPDPFGDDSPRFTITAQNYQDYADNLTAGQIALFKRYSTYQIPVYETRRTGAYPQAWYDETMQNPGRAKLAEGGNGVVGTTGGVPFPIPQNGSQVIWNALTRYRGESYSTSWSQAAVTSNGSYTPVRFEYEIQNVYGALSVPPDAREDNMLLYFLQKVTAPARLSGFVLLVHETLDQTAEPRKAWTYNPGQRRVRLAPNVAYDSPGTAADGLRTNDDFNLFVGATDRYDWELVGKKEIYIPYNAYQISGNAVSMDEYITANHPNQSLARYELHRVWVVEATVKPGKSHIYARRTFYFDEDSWQPMLTDKYDSRGELYRVGELAAIQCPDFPMVCQTVELHYDLQSGRYLAMNLRNDEDEYFEELRGPGNFTPQSLRTIGFQ